MMLRVILSITMASLTLSTSSYMVNGTSCTVTSYSNVASAISNCSNIVLKDFTVPAGKTLGLSLKKGAKLTFEGTIKFEHHVWSGPLITVKGKGVTVTGASGSVLDGQGAKYWDGKGEKGTTKPKFFKISTTGSSTLSNIKLLNCPVHCVSVSASDTTLSGWTIDVSAGDTAGGHNTDGFDIYMSKNLVIKESVIKNQDDCVAINGGSDIQISGLTCSGGHGLSLSVGLDQKNGTANRVSNVVFSDCTVKNSDNGIHIKTHTDAPADGYIKDVTYENIILSSIRKYGVNIQEDYKDGAGTGKPVGSIPITNLKLKNVEGTMTGGVGVYILCGTGGCSNWSWSNVDITGSKKSNHCSGYTPSGFSGC